MTLEPNKDSQPAQAEPGKSNIRNLSGFEGKIVSIVAIIMSAFHLWVLGFHPLDPLIMRASTLFFASILGFCLFPAGSRSSRTKVPWYDYVLILMCVASYAYIVYDSEGLIFRMGVMPTTADVIMGTFQVLCVLELARRTMGRTLPLFGLVLIGYTMIGRWMPGMFNHPGYTFTRSMSFMYGLEAIYGIPLGVTSTYVMVFLIFGAFLEVSGAKKFFMDLAQAVAGQTRGGPAKVAVVSSAFFGSINGSTVANVVATGVFTIPMMKKTGYPPQFAAAVEAVASTGGTILPPVMGAAAFLMVELVGVPYSTIAVAAAIPALLYYAAAYWMIDLKAQEMNLRGLSKDELPKFGEVLKSGIHLLLPIVVLVYTLIGLQMSPLRAGLLSIITTIVTSWFNKKDKIGVKEFIEALRIAGQGSVQVVAAVTVAGITIGDFALTGLGLKFASIVLGYSGGNLLLTLVLTMVVCVVLGMGMPTTGSYIIAATLAAPALIQLGVAPLVAHLFVLYFANISNITPPVALASYTAAGIAEAKAEEAGWEAFKLGMAGFIVPFMFVYGPSLLCRGSALDVIFSSATAFIGILALGIALQGWFGGYLKLILRGLFLVGALCLIKPGITTDIVGILTILVALRFTPKGYRMLTRAQS